MKGFVQFVSRTDVTKLPSAKAANWHSHGRVDTWLFLSFLVDTVIKCSNLCQCGRWNRGSVFSLLGVRLNILSHHLRLQILPFLRTAYLCKLFFFFHWFLSVCVRVRVHTHVCEFLGTLYSGTLVLVVNWFQNLCRNR